MTKINVFIDFEAISSPFNWDIGHNFDIPFSYSIGIFVGKKFKYKTYIINFKHVSMNRIYREIKSSIISNIRNILNNRNFKINKDTVNFIGYAPLLEKQILSKIIKGAIVKDVSKGKTISLEKVTENEMGSVTYFAELKKAVNNSFEEKFIKRRGLSKDGALAALAGYILYIREIPGNYKFDVPVDKKILIKELATYSRDDVIRMKYIYKDFETFLKRYKKWELIIKESEKQAKEAKIIDTVLTSLSNENEETKISDLVRKLKKRRLKLNPEKIKEVKL